MLQGFELLELADQKCVAVGRGQLLMVLVCCRGVADFLVFKGQITQIARIHERAVVAMLSCLSGVYRNGAVLPFFNTQGRAALSARYI